MNDDKNDGKHDSSLEGLFVILNTSSNEDFINAMNQLLGEFADENEAEVEKEELYIAENVVSLSAYRKMKGK